MTAGNVKTGAGLADSMVQYRLLAQFTTALKGARVEIFGKLRDRRRTAKDGSKRQAVEIVADTIEAEEKDQPKSQPATTNIHGLKVTDEDIPF